MFLSLVMAIALTLGTIPVIDISATGQNVTGVTITRLSIPGKISPVWNANEAAPIDVGEPTPYVRGVQQRSQQSFAATVEGDDNISQTVIWSVDGATSAGTSISEEGVLTIGPDELVDPWNTEGTGGHLIIRATSIKDPDKTGTTTIRVASTVPKTPAGSPYLPLWERIPDGEPRVFDDPDNPGKKRVYIYGSVDDLEQSSYCGWVHVTWSAPLEDLSDWRYDGLIFDKSWCNGKSIVGAGGIGTYANNASENLYAPDVVYNPVTQKYYLYTFLVTSSGTPRIWVAESSRPDGPYCENVRVSTAGWYNNSVLGTGNLPPTFQGTSRATSGTHPGGFDPGTYVEVTEWDDDGNPTDFSAWIYFGFQHPYMAELEKDMSTVKVETLKGGTAILGGASFFEASSMRKVDNTYCFVYTTGSGELRYATGTSPEGPFTFQNNIISTASPNWTGGNNHGSIAEINGDWYVFGHRHAQTQAGSSGATGIAREQLNNARRQAIVQSFAKTESDDGSTSGNVRFSMAGYDSMGFAWREGLNPVCRFSF